jgi:hypothetical protein
MSKVNLPPIPGGYLSLGAMNSRFAAIEAAFDNTVSRDGTLPNSMKADLDMDGNDLLNVDTIFASTVNANSGIFSTLSVGGTQLVSIDSIMQDDRHTVFVGEFGAVGNGVTDDTAAVQEAIEYAAERLLTLVFDGTYLVGELDYPDHIDWLGKNGATLLYNAPGADPLRDWIEPNNIAAYNVTEGKYYGGRVEGLAFDYNSGTHTFGRNLFLIRNPFGWHFENCSFRNMRQRSGIFGLTACELVDDFPAVLPMGGVTIHKCLFWTELNGGGFAFHTYPHPRVGPILLKGFSITECEFYTGSSQAVISCPGAESQSYRLEANALEYFRAYKDILFRANRMRGNGLGAFGTIPIEFWGGENYFVTENYITDATRGIGFSGIKNAVCSNNTISNQTSYAAEIGGPTLHSAGFLAPSEDLVWESNVCTNCASMVAFGASAAKNIVIANNVHRGTGLNGWSVNTHSVSFGVALGTAEQKENTREHRKNISVTGNEFIDLEYISSAVRLAEANYYSIKNNSLRSTTSQSAVTLVNVGTLDRYVSVVGNTVAVSANRDPTTLQSGMMLLINRPCDSVVVTNNNLISTATDTTIPADAVRRLSGIGAIAGTAAMDNTVIANNNLAGKFWQCFHIISNSPTTVVGPNNRDGAVEESTETEFNRRPQATYTHWRTERHFGGPPAVGQWFRGDVIRHHNPSVGQPIGWVCTASGTPGTWVAMANL